MNAMQNDVGRQTKVVAIGAAVTIAAAIYLIYSYASGGETRPSTIGPVQQGQPSAVVESEYYRDVLARYNQKNAASATENGESYVSVFSARPVALQGTPSAPTPQPAEPAATDPTFNQKAGDAASGQPQTPPAQAPDRQRQQEQLTQQAEALMNNWAAGGHSAARISETDFTLNGATATLAREPGMRNASYSAGPEPHTAGPIVPALTVLPAVLATDIDTDENSIVEVNVPSGKFGGATVIALGYKLAGNGVDMTFTLMKWQGRSYRIHAKPVDQTSMRSTLSGEVNNRYLSRILWPAIASGLGRTGHLFEQADTQSIVTPLGGVIQTHPGSPSSRSIAGTIVGGGAAEAGQVLRQDANQRPLKQVLIPRDLTLGVRFLEPVFAGDDLSESKQRSAATPSQTRDDADLPPAALAQGSAQGSAQSPSAPQP